MIRTVFGEMSISLAFITYVCGVGRLVVSLSLVIVPTLPGDMPRFLHTKHFFLLPFLVDLDFMPSRSVFGSFSSRFFCHTAMFDTSATKPAISSLLFSLATPALRISLFWSG